MNIVKENLFRTESLKLAEENNPFWYTSGKIGPFFINTHYLFGDENLANDFLAIIDKNLNNKEKLIEIMESEVLANYNSNPIYQEVIDYYFEELNKIEEFKNAKYISGGERRDWFFSIILSILSKKEHLYIFKDLSVFSKKGKIENVENALTVHIADLITEASSYERAWIPALKNINAKFTFTSSVVDRCQGGKEFLEKNNIKVHSLVYINNDFFMEALNNKIINKEQYNAIINFINDPDKYGKDFIMQNPDFLKRSLNSDNKSIKDKANRCITENPYNIDFKEILQ